VDFWHFLIGDSFLLSEMHFFQAHRSCVAGSGMIFFPS
jgi:hypothetical protein